MTERQTNPINPLKINRYSIKVGDPDPAEFVSAQLITGAFIAVKVVIAILFKLRLAAKYGFLNCSDIRAKLTLCPEAPKPNRRKDALSILI